MKKIPFLIILFFFASSVVQAESLIETFTDNATNPWLPTLSSAEEGSFTSSQGATWKLTNAYYYSSYSSLRMKKTEGKVVLPTVDGIVTSIKITALSNSITQTGTTVDIYANESKLTTKELVGGSDESYIIQTNMPIGTEFYISNPNYYTCITKITIVYKPTTVIEANLSNTLNSGKKGDPFKINMSLTGIYADNDNGILYAKTDNGACSNISTNENIGRDYYADDADIFDQSDWVALKIANPSGYVNMKFDPGITGIWNGSTLEVDNAPSGTDIGYYKPNLYEPHNFIEVMNNNNQPIFYVTPQVNEYAVARGHIVSNGNGGYNLSTIAHSYNSEVELLVPIDNSIGLITSESVDHYARINCIVKKDANNEIYLYALSTPSITTGVDANVASDNSVTVYGTHGAVSVEGVKASMTVSVYDATGREVKATQVDTDTIIALPSGFYVVRTGDYTTKVIVK